jgi:hypothetical protein
VVAIDDRQEPFLIVRENHGFLFPTALILDLPALARYLYVEMAIVEVVVLAGLAQWAECLILKPLLQAHLVV